MSLLKEIIEELLLENIATSRVYDAIRNKYEVTINYHSNGEDIATGERLIQPVAYGLTKAGNPVIRAYQPQGDTTTKNPSWKFFRVDRIDSWTPHKENTFEEPPYGGDGTFNPNGDKTMKYVYMVADFGNDEENNRENSIIPNNGGVIKTTEPKSSEVFKTDTEKEIAKRKEQLNNIQKVPQDVIDRYNREKNIKSLKNKITNNDYISDIVKRKAFNTTNPIGGALKNNSNTNSNTKQETNNNFEVNNSGAVYKTDTEREIDRKQE